MDQYPKGLQTHYKLSHTELMVCTLAQVMNEISKYNIGKTIWEMDKYDNCEICWKKCFYGRNADSLKKKATMTLTIFVTKTNA